MGGTGLVALGWKAMGVVLVILLPLVLGVPTVVPLNGTCMTHWLRLSLADQREEVIAVQEQRFGHIAVPLDEVSLPDVDPYVIHLLLGTEAERDNLVNCLSKLTESCRRNPPCLNGGSCVYEPPMTAVGVYQCRCAPGYTGSRCERALSPCSSTPCQNGATCRPWRSSGSPAYLCICPRSCRGRNCQTCLAQIPQKNISLVLAKALERLDAVEQRVELSGRNRQDIRSIYKLLSVAQSASLDQVNALEAKTTKRFERVERNVTALQTQAGARGAPLLEALSNRLRKAERRISEQERSWDNLQRILYPSADETPTVQAQSPPSALHPRSCKDIRDLSGNTTRSGYYYILVNDQRTKVYCEMEREGGGWTRLAVIDPSNSGSCPGSLYYADELVKLCSRNPAGTARSCAQASFSPPHPYSDVMGRVTGYTHDDMKAFYMVQNSLPSDIYAAGALITKGSPMKHVWTYTSSSVASPPYSCPCTATRTAQAPAFVGSDYYCHSDAYQRYEYVFEPRYRLWSPTSTCYSGPGRCCQDRNMPWFVRRFEARTNDQLHLRICGDIRPRDGDIGIDRAAFYVR